jgi:hypothetical protein
MVANAHFCILILVCYGETAKSLLFFVRVLGSASLYGCGCLSCFFAPDFKNCNPENRKNQPEKPNKNNQLQTTTYEKKLPETRRKKHLEKRRKKLKQTPPKSHEIRLEQGFSLYFTVHNSFSFPFSFPLYL